MPGNRTVPGNLSYLLIWACISDRNNLLGGIRVQRHGCCETAVQGGVVMHFVLQRAAANQLESSIARRPAVVLMI